MTWDLSNAPELREALVELLADALVGHVERSEADTGVTRGGLNRTAESVHDGASLASCADAGPAAGAGSPPVLAVASRGVEKTAPCAASASTQAVSGLAPEGAQKGAL